MNSVPSLQHLQRLALEIGGTAQVAGRTINAQGQQARTSAPRPPEPSRGEAPAAPLTLDDIRALMDERITTLERRIAEMLQANPNRE